MLYLSVMKIQMLEAIFDHAEYRENCALITDRGENITYAALRTLVCDLGEKLHSGSLALLVMKNDLGSVVFYLACLKMHVVPILLDKTVSDFQLQLYIRKYEPELIFLSGGGKAADRIREQKHYRAAAEVLGHVLLEKTYRRRKKIHASLALLLPTSGTTYLSKLVRISYGNLYDNAKNICETLGIVKEDRAVTSLPLSYCYGLSILNTHLLKHATVLLTDKSVLQKSFWDFAGQYGATSFAGVPYTYELLEQSGHIRKPNSIKVYTQAGGRLSTDLQRKFREYCVRENKKFFVMYGMTEATARISVLPMAYAEDKPGSVGKPITGGQVLIDREHESDLKGEIIYAGQNVCYGYCTCLKDLALGDVNQGILHTGDYGYLDEDGFLYVTGRKNDFIKMYGRRICLNSISQLIEELCGATAVCTFEHGRIHITYEHRSQEKILSVKETLHRHLHIMKSDLAYHVVDKFKRTYNGKVYVGERDGEYT